MNDKWVLAGFIGICIAVELLSGLATQQSVGTWYQALRKPAWTPPGWLFGPVWTALYISMGVAAWLVWRQRGHADVSLPLTIFGAQLLLNGIWSLLFFGMRQTGWALVEISLLWVALAITLYLFWRVNLAAGLLLVPYLAWVSFASFLNGAIWRLNS